MTHQINRSYSVNSDLENIKVSGSSLPFEMIDNEGSTGSWSEDEVAFFEAVGCGDKEIVEELINVKHVDVNCKNYNGETALHIAVKEEAVDMMHTLLRNKAEIGSALFEAVRKDSLQCVRILVAYDPNTRRGTAAKTIDRRSAAMLKDISGNFDEFLTPLELAVVKGNSEIVEFLIGKGFKVEDPRSYKTEDFEDQNEKETMIRLRDSLVKLNTYRALANPLYIAHSFLHDTRERKTDLGKKNIQKPINDPLLRSIALKKKLKDLSRREGEFRDDYIALSEQSENFAIQLLNECRNLEEIAAVMDMPELEKTKEHVYLKEHEQRLGVLNLAIKYRNRKVSESKYNAPKPHNHNHLPSIWLIESIHGVEPKICMKFYYT